MPAVAGTLGHRSGVFRTSNSVYPCLPQSYAHIRVHQVPAARVVRMRDGQWLLVGNPPTVVPFWVLGGGMVVDNATTSGFTVNVYGVACGTLSGCVPCGTGLLPHFVIGSRGQLDFADDEEILVVGNVITPTLALGTYEVHIDTPYVKCNSLSLPWSAHYLGGG
jgi:hypothetical protein